MKETDNNKRVKYPAYLMVVSASERTECGGFAIFNSVVSTGLTEIRTSEQRLEGGGGEPCRYLGESVRGEGTASSNTLGQECAVFKEHLSEEKAGKEVRKEMVPPCK